MIYVYAIVGESVGPEALPAGVGGAPVALATEAGVAAAYSSVESGALEPTEALLWEHERVAEALMQEGAVLPVRFGSILPSVEDLVALLKGRSATLRSSLERVEGAVEVSVRAALPVMEPEPSAPAEAGPGRAYLMSQHRMVSPRAREQLESLHEILSGVARASTHSVKNEERPSLVAAYLVDAEGIKDFVGRVEELRRERPDLDLICTGPWPPYNFVETGVDAS